MNRKTILIIGIASLIIVPGIVLAAQFDQTGNSYTVTLPNEHDLQYGEYDYNNNNYIYWNNNNGIVYVLDSNFNVINYQSISGIGGGVGPTEYHNGRIYGIKETNGIWNLTSWDINSNGVVSDSQFEQTLDSSEFALPRDFAITNDYIILGDPGSSSTNQLIILDRNGNNVATRSITNEPIIGVEQMNQNVYALGGDTGQVFRLNLTNLQMSTVTDIDLIDGGDEFESFVKNQDNGNWYATADSFHQAPNNETTVTEYEGAIPLGFQQNYNISGKVTDRDQAGIFNATISINASIADVSTDQGGNYVMSVPNGTYQLTASKDNYASDSATVTVNGSDVTQHFRLIQEELRYNLKINNFMKHGSEQNYEATYVAVVNYNLAPKDVTDQITISSNNSSIVSVHTSNNTLIATSDKSINAQVEITSSYTNSDGKVFYDNESVTVANRTIDNIDIMPPSQIPNAFLGIGEDGTLYGLGSEIQWIFLIVIFGAVIGKISKNEWLGIASMEIALSIFWLMGNVSVGITMVGILVGIAMGLVLLDIPSRHDTNISVESNQQTDFQENQFNK